MQNGLAGFYYNIVSLLLMYKYVSGTFKVDD